MPASYFVLRKDGQPYSTDRSPLELNPGPNVLIHFQRQRLLLELQYHQCYMSLYRPFICFASSSEVPTLRSDSQAAAALNHAMALTRMIHQAVTFSEVLSGIYHIFRWQNNALFTMLGYAYTFPVSHLTGTIRKTVFDMAVVVIDMYHDTLPEASRVAVIARVMARDLGAMIASFYTSGNSWSLSSLGGPVTAASDEAPSLPDKTDLAVHASMVAPPAIVDEDLDLGFLQDLGNAGSYSWEDMDLLWASLGGAGLLQ